MCPGIPFDLLPRPRRVEMTGGTHQLRPGRLILLDTPDPQSLRAAAARIQDALRETFGFDWEMVASDATPSDLIGLRLRVAPRATTHPQGYDLSITSDGISITAPDASGVFYGACTLAQILAQQDAWSLPALHISDWPDYAARGVLLDISRDKVPTMATLRDLIDMLAGWKINQIQLYTEHTFAYRAHPEVWAEASPMTGEEILELDAYCRDRCIELVPNQNSFGHMGRWLRHPRYAPLAEIHGPFMSPWGAMTGPFSLCPVDPGSLNLVRGLLDELLPHFSSRQCNVGCDETVDLGQGRSQEACERLGVGRVYLRYLLAVYEEVKARGRTMQYWDDVIVHYPDLIRELPDDAIALEWGYEADHPFAGHLSLLAQAGIPFYVCPGTSSWCSIAGRTDNALGNLRNAAANGLLHGATGYLNTDWGDNGHWQSLPVSYMGFAAGAAYSWAWEANSDLDVARSVSLHAFHDATGSMGRVAYDLGNVYRAVGMEPPNSSALFWLLQMPEEQLRADPRFSMAPGSAWESALAAIDAAMAPLAVAESSRHDAALIRREFELAARLLRHACRRALFVAGAGEKREALLSDLDDIIDEYRAIWSARNRPGGLSDSVARFQPARADYLRV